MKIRMPLHRKGSSESGGLEPMAFVGCRSNDIAEKISKLQILDWRILTLFYDNFCVPVSVRRKDRGILRGWCTKLLSEVSVSPVCSIAESFSTGSETANCL